MADSVVRFDGQALFGLGKHVVKVSSRKREQVERGFGGLDGMVSIDLGERGRSIQQVGTLISQSVAELGVVKDRIEAYIDGMAYVLIDQDGRSLGQVRMDTFEAKDVVVLASQVRCGYDIQYTQLRV